MAGLASRCRQRSGADRPRRRLFRVVVVPATVDCVTARTAALTARRVLDSSSAWRMLRAVNAPVVLAVLGEHLGGQVRRLAAPLLFEAVDADLEDLRAAGFDVPLSGSQYCRQWLSDGYLVRRPGETRDEVYELSDGALAAIRFVEQLGEQRTTVTESRLATIVERVHRLAVDTDPDVTRRAGALQAERDRMDQQIAALADGRAEVLPDDRALERALDVLSLAAQLPEDFARVRSTMEQINRDLRARLVEEPQSRGVVLDDVFRGVDLLADSEAGRSFSAFYTLVLDAERTSALEDETDELVDRPFARDLSRDQARALGRLLPTMLTAGGEIHQVMTSFSRSLRRLVVSEELAEERAVHQLVRRALVEARRLVGRVQPYHQVGVELGLTSVPVARLAGMRLHDPADAETVREVLSDQVGPADLAMLRELVRTSEIDFAELTGDVNAVLAERGAVTIAEVLAARPATQGAASVVGLLVLAEAHATAVSAHGDEHVTWTSPVSSAAPGVTRGADLPCFLFETELP